MRIISKLIPLFIIVPLVELAILIQIGKWLGVWETIGLCIITGVLGAILVQIEGFKICAKLQAELVQLRMPTNQLIDGVLILIGGIMLLTPGILTDLIGLTLLLPFSRPLYRAWLKKKFEKKILFVGQNNYQSQRKKAEVKVIEERGKVYGNKG